MTKSNICNNIIPSDINALDIHSGIGYHNSIYRGKQLCPTGQGPTASQYKSISDGTFDDLYIGDYWTLNVNANRMTNWRIMAFDYYLHIGETNVFNLNTHHAIIVPDNPLYDHYMNATNTSDGGYVNSDMWKTGLNKAKQIIGTSDASGGYGHFAGHIIKFKDTLTNAISNGVANGVVWCDCEVNLMNEDMVYGQRSFSQIANNARYMFNKPQLLGFTYRPDLITDRSWYWLTDIAYNGGFANVDPSGISACYASTTKLSVRPFFLIG